MRPLRSIVLPALLVLLGPLAAQGGDDPLDQPVQGSSHPLPEGTPSVSPDSLTTESQSPDADVAHSESPDAELSDTSRPVIGHAVSPDSITTTSEDLSDLPPASRIDQAPASIAPAAARPAGCSQPADDAGWSACLSSLSDRLANARSRLEAADAAYSRSITSHVPTGEARLAIIEERDAAQAEVAADRTALASQVSQALQAGASSWVTAPYPTQAPGW